MKYLPYPAPVPLDKGNAGSKNEIAAIFLNDGSGYKESRIRNQNTLDNIVSFAAVISVVTLRSVGRIVA